MSAKRNNHLTMDKSKTSNSSDSEEVDLGQLFNAIGAGFASIFRFFKNSFACLFDLILDFVVFVRERVLIFATVTVIGMCVGTYIDLNQGPTDVSNRIVNTNFESGYLLYEEVDYLGALLNQKDTVQLKKKFGITSAQAEWIDDIEVKPIEDQREKLLAYDRYRLKMDTTIVENAYSFKEFSKEFNPYQYGKHIIEVTVFDTSVLSQIESGLLSSLKTNQRLIAENQNEVQNIDLSNKILLTSISRIDSLLLAEQLATTLSAESSGNSGTAISMSENSRNAKEVQLVELKVKLMEELQANSRLRLRTDNIIEEITSLSDTVYRETSITKKSAVKLGVLAFLSLSFLYALLWFDKFLRTKIANKSRKA